MYKMVFINADGASSPNPGHSAIGVVIRSPSKESLEFYSECIGRATSNEAEYNALIKSLNLAKKYTSEKVVIYMDSNLIVNQFNGDWKIKEQRLQVLCNKARKEAKNFKKVTLKQVSRWVPLQAEADELAEKLLSTEHECKYKEPKSSQSTLF